MLLALLAGCGSSHAAAPARGEDGPDDRLRYDRYRRPAELVGALGLSAGDRVADVGAGEGYLTFRLADAVGAEGHVLATDVDAMALMSLRAHRLFVDGASRVSTRHVASADPGLEAGAYDVVLLAQVDHLLPDRVAYLRRLRVALAPGGRIAVANRLPYRAPTLAAAAAAGLTVVTEHELPAQFLVLLEAAR